jgi:hypothetical protein
MFRTISRYLDNNVLTASGASCSLDSARLESPAFFFLSVLSTISCDEDDDPVFGASCGSGVLGCLIAEYQSHRLSLQSHPRVDSDGQHGGLHIICAGSVVSALVAGTRIGYRGLHFRRALCSNRRRNSDVYRGARGEGPSSAYQLNACSSATSLAPNEE